MRSFGLSRVVRGGVLSVVAGTALGCSGELAGEPGSAPRLGVLSAALAADEPITLTVSAADGFTSSSGLFPLPCAAGDELRALPTLTAVDVTFTNDSEDTYAVYWISYDGALVLYNTLAPHTSYTQPSYSGHPWLVTDLFDCQIVLTMGHGVRSGPATLASEGVAVLASDEVTPENLSAIEIGGTLLDIGDPTSVQWVAVDEDNATGTVVDALSKTAAPSAAAPTGDVRLLLKAPATLATGTQLVRLTTTSGSIVDWAFESVAPTFGPPPPRGILWHEDFASDDVFPVLTQVQNRFTVADVTAELAEWMYIFNASSDASGASCEDEPRQGRVGGQEVFYRGGITREESRGRFLGCGGSTSCDRLEGTYELGPEGNTIDVTIQRDSGPERFVGGWVADIPSDPALWGQLPAPIDGSRYVVLTSTLTGRQIAFEYQLASTCNSF
jgi:hypothetical protein